MADYQTRVETITPALAAAYLERNTRNRSVKSKKVAEYAKAMTAGHWKMNGEAIKFNGDGTLLDGQHRLHACIASETPFDALVITGIESDAQATMDTGARRTAGDALQLYGVPDAKRVAAAVSAAIQLKELPRQVRPTHAEILEFYEANPEIKESAKKFKRAPRGVAPLGAALHYIAGVIEPDLQPQIIDQIADGFGPKGAPFLVIRNRFIKATLAGQSIDIRHRIALLCTAFKAAREGRNLEIVKAMKEPRIAGWSV